MRRLIFLLPFFLLPFAFAHRGFERLAWREDAAGYTLSVLADFHAADIQDGSSSQLFVQLSRDGEAPAETTVRLELSYQDEQIYAGEVPFVTNSSDDGKTFYAAYIIDLALPQQGYYDATLSIDGPAGAVTRSYGAATQRGVSWLEYLPSLLILGICVGGAALLFIPVKRAPSNRAPSKHLPSKHLPSKRKDRHETLLDPVVDAH